MSHWAAVSYGPKVNRGAAGLALVRELEMRGLKVAGYVQHKRGEPGSETIALERLGRSELAVLGERGKTPSLTGVSSASACSFSFRADAFDLALTWLRQDAVEADLMFLGELGRLEAEGAGHASTFEWALRQSGNRVVVFCTRADRLEQMVNHFQLSSEPVAHVEQLDTGVNVGAFADQVAAAVTRVRRG